MHGGKGLCWAWPAAGCVVRATFPSAPLDADIISTLALEARSRKALAADTVTPRIHGYVRDLGWMGAITPGMARKRVLALTSELPSPEAARDELIWRVPLKHDDKRDGSASESAGVRRWAAVLSFSNGKLQTIRVAAQ